jgi:DNA repair protein RecN (Recombination protein N)
MLRSLTIQNYVLIDRLEVDFESGMNVLTGETGAGKSILLGALGLILGGKAEKNTIRNRANRCIIEAKFCIKNLNLNNFFDQNELSYAPECIIRRVIPREGVSRVFVNDEPCRVEVLRKLGRFLVDIHSQHQSLQIRDVVFQGTVLDHFSDLENELRDYQCLWQKHKTVQAQYQEKADWIESVAEKKDFYIHQLQKFEALGDDIERMSQIEEAYRSLQHQKEVFGAQQSALAIMEDSSVSPSSTIEQIICSIQKVKAYNPEVQSIVDSLQQAQIILSQAQSEVEHLSDTPDFEELSPADLEQKMGQIYQLIEIFGVQRAPELLKRKEALEEKLERLATEKQGLEILESEILEQEKVLRTRAEEISKIRRARSSEFSRAMEAVCRDLGMEKIHFEIHIKSREKLNERGMDDVEFYFSSNQNQPLKPLSRVVSGGEMARLVFALKYLMAQVKTLGTVIFDEIDTGISGRIAEKMGRFMCQMSRTRPLIVITHLPQIAAQGDVHFLVQKIHTEEGTQTTLKKLNPEEREREIAQMLSGARIEEAALEQARVLLRGSEKGGAHS